MTQLPDTLANRIAGGYRLTAKERRAFRTYMARIRAARRAERETKQDAWQPPVVKVADVVAAIRAA